MRALMTVDVGGTSIKFGYYANHQLHRLTDCPTPATLADYYRVIAAQKDALAGDFNLVGVAVSSPGAVNKKTGVIEGSSAIDYIHNFPIRQQLAQRLKTQVSLENDANCAGLGESFFGAGKDCHTIVAIVVGSGVGGAIVEDHRVRHGSHLFGGEFGYMIMRPTSGATLSHLVSPVAAAKAFSKKLGCRLPARSCLPVPMMVTVMPSSLSTRSRPTWPSPVIIYKIPLTLIELSLVGRFQLTRYYFRPLSGTSLPGRRRIRMLVSAPKLLSVNFIIRLTSWGRWLTSARAMA